MSLSRSTASERSEAAVVTGTMRSPLPLPRAASFAAVPAQGRGGCVDAGEVAPHRLAGRSGRSGPEQVTHDRGDAAVARGFLPGVDRFLAAKDAQGVEAGAERSHVADEEVVVRIRSATRASSGRSSQTHGEARMPLDQSLRHAEVADLRALALDEHRPRRIEPAQRVSQTRRVEGLLRRLRSPGTRPSTEPRWLASVSRSSTCAPRCGERGEQPALAGAGRAADDGHRSSRAGPRARRPRRGGSRGSRLRAGGCESRSGRAPGRARCCVGRRASSRRAATSRAAVEHVTLDMRGDVARDQRRAALLGGERRDLLVIGADRDPLGVVERRPVDRPGERSSANSLSERASTMASKRSRRQRLRC